MRLWVECCLGCVVEEEDDVDLRDRTSCLEQDCDSGSRMTCMDRGLIGWEVLREGLAIGMDFMQEHIYAFPKMNSSLICYRLYEDTMNVRRLDTLCSLHLLFCLASVSLLCLA